MASPGARGLPIYSGPLDLHQGVGVAMLPGKSARRRRSRMILLEACEPRTLLTTFYVSPGGDDANAGTSPAAAWKTVAKINSLDLEPGDRVLLQGGATFNAPTPSASNLASDGGFESGNLNSWTQSFDATAGNSSITTTSGNVHGGKDALRVGGTTAGGRGQTVTSKVKAAKQYLLKLWAKLVSGSGAARAGITFYSAGNAIAESIIPIGGGSYTQYTAALVAPDSLDS